MTKLIGTAPNQVPTNADLGKLAYQDAIAVGTGTAGQVLQSGGATAAPAWATVSSGTPPIIFPSDWTSPNSTYTSSGTWSKGSLSDDDYVWFYLVAGGGGGVYNSNFASGGKGGNALLLYGKAGLFNGKAYVVGAGDAGQTSGEGARSGGVSSVAFGGVIGTLNTSLVSARSLDAYSASAVSYQNGNNFTISHDGTYPTGYTAMFNTPQGSNDTPNSKSGVFSGGGGGNLWHTNPQQNGTSFYAGAGGAYNASGQGLDGVAPGGGGGATRTSGQRGGNGADGSVRVYHV